LKTDPLIPQGNHTYVSRKEICQGEKEPVENLLDHALRHELTPGIRQVASSVIFCGRFLVIMVFLNPLGLKNGIASQLTCRTGLESRICLSCLHKI